MANKVYAKGAEKILSALIDLATDDIRVVAVSSSYTFDQAAHEFFSQLSPDTLGTPVALTSLSITGGVFDADDISYTLPSSTAKGFVIYKYDAVDSAAALLFYIDNIVGFPLTTSGGTIPIQWSSGASKIVSFLG